jgi:uncharacterized phage protein gp47/JayE
MPVTFLSDPEYASGNSAQDIVSRMLVSLPSQYDPTEGSFSYDLIAAFAAELESYYQALDQIALQVYPQTATDEYLDAISESFGVERSAATFASVDIQFTGSIGTVIPAGTRVSTLLEAASLGEPVYYQTINEVTMATATQLVASVCTQTGSVGNVSAGSILRLEDPIVGVTAVTNIDPSSGGAEEQTDDELRTVLLDRLRLGRGSGTEADYQDAALAVTGVGSVVTEPLWNGNGTVRVIVMDASRSPVASSILSSAVQAIAEMTPVGANVTVVTPSTVTLAVATAITLAAGYGIDDVQSSIEQAVAAYLQSVDPGGLVYLSEMLGVIVQIEGVVDVSYANLTIAGVNANYDLASNTKGLLGATTVTLS